MPDTCGRQRHTVLVLAVVANADEARPAPRRQHAQRSMPSSGAADRAAVDPARRRGGEGALAVDVIGEGSGELAFEARSLVEDGGDGSYGCGRGRRGRRPSASRGLSARTRIRCSPTESVMPSSRSIVSQVRSSSQASRWAVTAWLCRSTAGRVVRGWWPGSSRLVRVVAPPDRDQGGRCVVGGVAPSRHDVVRLHGCVARRRRGLRPCATRYGPHRSLLRRSVSVASAVATAAVASACRAAAAATASSRPRSSW